MPVPSLLDLMNPTLLALRELGGSAAVVELNEKIIQSISLADDVLSQPRSLRQIHDRMGFARTHLKEAGAHHEFREGNLVIHSYGLGDSYGGPCITSRYRAATP